LLEGLVFGARAGNAAGNDIANDTTRKRFDAERRNEPGLDTPGYGEIALAVRKRVKRLMWDRVGILRNRDSLKRALWEFDQIARAPLARPSRNFLDVASLIARSALWREESRGAHFRTDFPDRNDESWRSHSIVRAGSEMSSSAEVDFGLR
jgi:succinate dehydrogenase/fumarate reductase flavoprotein subunit